MIEWDENHGGDQLVFKWKNKLGDKMSQKKAERRKLQRKGLWKTIQFFWSQLELLVFWACLEQLLSTNCFVLLRNAMKQRDCNRKKQKQTNKKPALKWKTRKSTTTKRLELTFPVIGLVVVFPVGLIWEDVQKMLNRCKRRKSVEKKK